MGERIRQDCTGQPLALLTLMKRQSLEIFCSSLDTQKAAAEVVEKTFLSLTFRRTSSPGFDSSTLLLNTA
jgi:hypothetical protein